MKILVETNLNYQNFASIYFNKFEIGIRFA